MKISLESLRPCLDGAIPAVVATAAPDGTPNVAYASQVHYVDSEHVALSFQFFSKTRENVLAHPYAQVQVIEPKSFRHFRTLASLGYPASGVGAEVALGEGLIGVAARERIPVRINHHTSEYTYRAALYVADATAPRIPLPLLAHPHSQIAVPLAHGERLVGVLDAESDQNAFFSHADEDALAVYGRHLAALVVQLAALPDDTEPEIAAPPTLPRGTPLAVRYFAHDHSVLIDNDYLIKGVAGSILWTLLNEHAMSGRRDFCNRELRRDPRLPLPDFGDNLETRLILLRRRLAERCPQIVLQKTGRGRFRLELARPLQLDAG